MIPGIVAGAMFGVTVPGIPDPILVTEDPYRSATVLLMDATGQSDGTGYATDESYWANALTYVSGAAIASEKFSFNGTSDYITVIDKLIWTPDGMFCWELFEVEFDNAATDQVLLSHYQATSPGHSWRVRYDSTANQLTLDASSTTGGTLNVVCTASFTPATDGTKYTILVRSNGATISIYVNGVKLGTASYSSGFADGNALLRVGCDDGGSGSSPRLFFDGRMAAVRLTWGQDRTAGDGATYQRHALPLPVNAGTDGSSIPVPTFSNVKFLTGMEGTDGATTFTDDSGSPVTPTFVGNAQIDTAQFKYGSASLLLDGSGDYVALGHKADFTMGDAIDIVADGWAYLNVDGTGLYTIHSKRPTSGTATEWSVYVSNRLLTWVAWTGGSGSIVLRAPFPPLRWTYWAVMRSGTDVYMWIDGLLQKIGTQSATPSGSSNSLDIGRDRDFSGRDWNGWLDELRITRGEAFLPIGNFIPPTAAFPRS